MQGALVICLYTWKSHHSDFSGNESINYVSCLAGLKAVSLKYAWVEVLLVEVSIPQQVG